MLLSLIALVPKLGTCCPPLRPPEAGSLPQKAAFRHPDAVTYFCKSDKTWPFLGTCVPAGLSGLWGPILTWRKASFEGGPEVPTVLICLRKHESGVFDLQGNLLPHYLEVEVGQVGR